MDGHVFICYSRSDESFVLQLAGKLKNQGVPVWLDQWNIPPGANWDKTIEEALTSCSRLIIVLSPDAAKSHSVASEWNKALKDRKYVIPIHYKDCEIPYRLRLIQYIDFTSGRMDDNIALDQVLTALDMAESSLQKPAEITTPKMETPVSATTVAINNPIPAGSEVSDTQTLPEQTEVVASDIPEVYIQGRKYSCIQDAVDAGNPGDTIILTAGTYQENLLIEKSFTIKGAGEGETIIDGRLVGSVIIVGMNRSKIDVTLSGMTIKGGTGTSISVDSNDEKTYVCGGGIINYGRLTIKESIISEYVFSFHLLFKI